MTEPNIPTRAEVKSYLRDRRNWGRWGDRGGAGAVNLITPEKRLAAVGLVRTGRTVSLSRPLPVEPSEENPRPVQHYMKRDNTHGRGAAVDFIGIFQHGYSVTHIDALCHMWDDDGMWDGRDPDEEITFDGARYGSVDQWRDGILTRGVLLDVPRHRGEPYVTVDAPVHGWELAAIAAAQRVSLEPGDAVLVYCGREAHAADRAGAFRDNGNHPGLHASCLPFIRDHDVALLGWDMADATPNEYGLPATMHGILFAYGVPLLDNALLAPLAQAAAEEGRYEFMLTINPLVAVGATGSPVNPIAVF